MEKDPMELLEIDFGKYCNISLNGVFIAGMEVEVEDQPIQVNLFGKIDGKLVINTSFMKNDKVRITELSKNHLSIREVKKCIYCSK